MELAAILAILKTVLASGWTLTAAGVLATWLLGRYREMPWYQKCLAAIGKSTFAAFSALSRIGETRFGKTLWLPIEKVLCDIIFVFCEQSTAGLRSDNIEKLEDQLDRLKDVNSVVRAEAVEMKLEQLKNPGIPMSTKEAAELARLNLSNSERAKDLLKDM